MAVIASLLPLPFEPFFNLPFLFSLLPLNFLMLCLFFLLLNCLSSFPFFTFLDGQLISFPLLFLLSFSHPLSPPLLLPFLPSPFKPDLPLISHQDIKLRNLLLKHILSFLEKTLQVLVLILPHSDHPVSILNITATLLLLSFNAIFLLFFPDNLGFFLELLEL